MRRPYSPKALSPGAETGLPGAGFVTVLRQAGLRDVQLRRRVLIDRPQQFEAALGPCGIAFLSIGPVALQSISGVDRSTPGGRGAVP